MQPAFICLGKTGDILNTIALAQHKHSSAVLITSQKGLSVSTGFPGIIPVVYPGQWDDLAGAIIWAKQRFKTVISVQTYGKDFPIEHRRPSFQLDQALRAGVTDFENVRLKIGDNHATKKDNSIFFADHSESSPFGKADDLYDSLVHSFGKHFSIVRVSRTKPSGSGFLDYLSAYERSACIISVDTAHLHLTSGISRPVIALAADTPTVWHGSAYHPRYAMHCRYGDYEARKKEMLWTIQEAVSNRTRANVVVSKTVHKNAYNPSIIEWQGKTLTCYRYNPDPKLWPTMLAIDGQPIAIPQGLDRCSIEDPRFFIFQGKLHLSYVFVPYPVPAVGASPCGIGYGEVVNDGSWKLITHNVVKYGKNDLSGQEKNWVFFEAKGTLYCIYQCSPEQIVLQLEGTKVVKEFRTKSPQFIYGNIRGGTQPLPYKGLWLRFFHCQVGGAGNPRPMYYLAALTMETTPPFQIMSVSKMPIVSGNEQYFSDWKWWKPRCLLVYGAIQNRDGWILSAGVNDSVCGEIEVSQDQLNL